MEIVIIKRYTTRIACRSTVSPYESKEHIMRKYSMSRPITKQL